jgi:hypothetical protein
MAKNLMKAKIGYSFKERLNYHPYITNVFMKEEVRSEWWMGGNIR